ncbi:MAG: ice-binding family protein [Sedimentisphaerales bacterium]|jgi:hypothetical protein
MENNTVSGIVAKPKLLFICLLVLTLLPISAYAALVDLGTAGSFGVLAGSGVTNTGNTIINGDVGSSPTPAITGFPPGEVNGILYRAAGPVVAQAKLDLVAAYDAAVGAADGNTSEPADLSGKTLDPNIYAIGAASFGAGNLTLDGHGDPNAQWIFHTTVLTTAADFNVLLINGASANNVFWQVGTSATIAIRNSFAGNILAMTSITFNGNGTFNGRALARNGAVTISDAITVNVPDFVPIKPNILVYKMTTAINPVIDYEDANGLKANVLKENLSAYVVFGVDDAYGVDDVNNANGPTVILFGKDGTTKFQKTLGGNDPNSFVNIQTFGNVNSIMPFEVTNMRNTNATDVGIGFGDSDATTGFDIGTSLYGVNSTIDIGQAEKFSVAKSLKGQVWIYRQFVNGWGAATVSLDSKLTKDANKNGRTVAATVANIKTTVLNTYTPVDVLP